VEASEVLSMSANDRTLVHGLDLEEAYRCITES